MSDWISVDDSLPEDGRQVVVLLADDMLSIDGYRVDFDYIETDEDCNFYWANNDTAGHDISHWMDLRPLPEPPETEAPEIFEGTREQLNNLGIR